MTETVWPWPNFYPHWNAPTAPAPQGCICPPTSEQTCENPICPRKNPFKQDRIP